MHRLLIRSKRRVLIASDYLERALAPGRASTRQSRPDATDRERFAPARSWSRGGFQKPERAFRFLPCGHGQQAANRSRSFVNGSETCRVDTTYACGKTQLLFSISGKLYSCLLCTYTILTGSSRPLSDRLTDTILV